MDAVAGSSMARISAMVRKPVLLPPVRSLQLLAAVLASSSFSSGHAVVSSCVMASRSRLSGRVMAAAAAAAAASASAPFLATCFSSAPAP